MGEVDLLSGDFEEYPTALASRIVSRFAGKKPFEAFDFPDRGNINHHTYLVIGDLGKTHEEYLLQQINHQVFRRPQDVMAAMIACIRAQRSGLAALSQKERPDWETIELIPTVEGDPYLESDCLRGRSYWRLMRRIRNCRTYKSLGEVGGVQDQLHLAEEAGRGLATFLDLTTTMDVSGLANPLPGYRDTGLYYDQLHSIVNGYRTPEEAGERLPDDSILRESTLTHFLLALPDREYRRRMELPDVQEAFEVALSNEPFAKTLQDLMDGGRIRRLAIHGDTKLDNFLFCQDTGRVKALVDLDTIMPHSWLADWGDMVRSLCNVAGERERDPTKIQVDLQIFQALARGFLSTVNTVTESEIALMVEAVEIIALELGVRFLTDYVRGDTYFKLSPTDHPDLNRFRGIGQLTLFRRLREQQKELKECITRLASKQ